MVSGAAEDWGRGAAEEGRDGGQTALYSCVYDIQMEDRQRRTVKRQTEEDTCVYRWRTDSRDGGQTALCCLVYSCCPSTYEIYRERTYYNITWHILVYNIIQHTITWFVLCITWFVCAYALWPCCRPWQHAKAWFDAALVRGCYSGPRQAEWNNKSTETCIHEEMMPRQNNYSSFMAIWCLQCTGQRPRTSDPDLSRRGGISAGEAIRGRDCFVCSFINRNNYIICVLMLNMNNQYITWKWLIESSLTVLVNNADGSMGGSSGGGQSTARLIW